MTVKGAATRGLFVWPITVIPALSSGSSSHSSSAASSPRHARPLHAAGSSLATRSSPLHVHPVHSPTSTPRSFLTPLTRPGRVNGPRGVQEERAGFRHFVHTALRCSLHSRRNRARGLCLSVHRSLHSPRVPRSFRPRSEGPFPPSVTSFPSLPCPVVSLATRDPTPLPSHHPSSGLGNGPRSPSSWRRFLLSSRTALARRCSPPPYGRGSPRPAALYGENERRGKEG